MSSSKYIILEDGKLSEKKRKIPQPGPGEILVRVKAFGINRADLLQRKGLYPAPLGSPQDILGLEYAGIIESIGPIGGEGSTTTAFKEGDAVMGICGGGAYAEHLIIHHSLLMHAPKTLNWAERAALPEVYMTAYDALFERAKLSRGERVLIHAIGSGVGVAAAHLCAWAGLVASGTTRSEWKQELALTQLPVDQVYWSNNGVFLTQSDEGKYDAIIDFIGASYLEQNLRALRIQGRLVVVGLLGGAKATLPLGILLRKRIEIVGTVLRNRSIIEKGMLVSRCQTHLLPAFENGRLTAAPPSKVYPAKLVDDAHDALMKNQNWGKLVCTW